jgi:hypothetical protein
MKSLLILAVLGLLAWTNRDLVSPEYQFWKKAETMIVVQNNSDRDIQNVGVIIWSEPHLLGTIPKGKSREFKMRRPADTTEVVVRFGYGGETIEHHAGTLTGQTGYRMVIGVNYAGIVSAQVGPSGQEVVPQLP